jgi:hypothetical protein
MNKLKKWRVALSVSNRNTGLDIELKDKVRSYKFKKVVRSGPSIGKNPKPSLSYSSLVDKNVFKARSSTIISPDDFSLYLTTAEIVKLKQNYHTKDKEKNKGKTVPDREYRSYMDPSQGLLVIYLIDLSKVFGVKPLKDYAFSKGINTDFQRDVPLIGYALGFPTDVGVNGADYVTQHVHKEPEDMTIEELKDFIANRDFDIDLNNDDWTIESLIEAIHDNPENDEDNMLDDGDEITVEIN